MKKVLRVFIIAIVATMFANVAKAQEQKNFTIDKLSVEGRVDYDYFFNKDKSGLDETFISLCLTRNFITW